MHKAYWKFRKEKLENKRAHSGYRDLREIVLSLSGKVGVYTTNIDGFFVQALGRHAPVFEVHGAMRLGSYVHAFDTGRRSKPKEYVERPHIVTFGEHLEQFRGMGRWDELIEGKEKFEALEEEAQGKIVILEIGVSSSVDSAPDKIESILKKNAEVTLVRLTKGEDPGSKKNPEDKDNYLIEFREGAGKALSEIKFALNKLRKRKREEPVRSTNKRQKN